MRCMHTEANACARCPSANTCYNSAPEHAQPRPGTHQACELREAPQCGGHSLSLFAIHLGGLHSQVLQARQAGDDAGHFGVEAGEPLQAAAQARQLGQAAWGVAATLQLEAGQLRQLRDLHMKAGTGR